MALSRILSRGQVGMEAPLVTVEVHISNGLPGLSIVGLPETAVKESKDRVRSALMNAGFSYPNQRITINLAPADLPKQGGRFDLPIALGILAASGQIDAKQLAGYEFAGELLLTGQIRPIVGAIPFALATKKDNHTLMIAQQNASEVALVEGLNAYGAPDLNSVVSHLQNKALLPAVACHLTPGDGQHNQDLSDVKGQTQAKRALMLAAAGGHNLLFVGPPGSGKTMLASRMVDLLPALTSDQALENAAIASIKGIDAIEQSFYQRPFRQPHYTASSAALVGGGSHPQPGEVSLAHHGVLFLDELPEFDRKVLEVLRSPLESGQVMISRAKSQVHFPANFQLIAAMNPCPCGYWGSQTKACRDSAHQIRQYQSKLSGPLLDRIDLQVEVLELDSQTLTNKNLEGDSSQTVRQWVTQARSRQYQRQQKVNAELSAREIDTICQVTDDATNLLQQAIDKMGLSARAYYRILKVARTIADIQASDTVGPKHIQEALNYRKLDRYMHCT